MKNALIGGFALLIATGCASASAMSLSSHPTSATPIELVGWGDNGQDGGYGGTQQNSGGGYGGQQSGGGNQQNSGGSYGGKSRRRAEQQPAGRISEQ